MLTNDEYSDKFGRVCPKCEREAVVATGQLEVADGGAIRKVRCVECSLEWDEVYMLSGYADPVMVVEVSREVMGWFRKFGIVDGGAR